MNSCFEYVNTHSASALKFVVSEDESESEDEPEEMTYRCFFFGVSSEVVEKTVAAPRLLLLDLRESSGRALYSELDSMIFLSRAI